MTARLLIRISAFMFSLALAACNGGSSTASGAGSAVNGVADPLLFSASNYTVAQTQGSVSLTVLRVGNAAAAVSVQYSTEDGTAVAGTDYEVANGTLQWAENDSTPKTIVVSMVNGAPFAGNRSFSVNLSNPSATAQISTPDSAVVTISGAVGDSVGSPQLSSSSYAVAQTTAQVMITVNRANGSNGAMSVGYATTNGTAVAGADFAATSGTLEWADGDATSKAFPIAISSSQPFIGSKTFGVALSSPSSGATLGVPGGATVAIYGSGSASAGTLHLSAANYSVGQGSGAFAISVERTGGSSGQVSVSYGTLSGTAVAGQDFTAVSGTLTWADGDTTQKIFSIPINSVPPFAGNKVFTVALSGPINGATVSSPGSASVTIAGDSTAAVGTLALGAATYTVAQTAGAVPVSVVRLGGSSGVVSVNYATQNGTAVAGTDFTATTGSLTWADGDAAAKTFSIPVSAAAPFSGTRSLKILLSTPGGGAALGSPASATASITGGASSSVGALQLAAASYAVAQSAGSVAVTVNRTGGSTGAVSAAYQTSAVTAVAGVDYTSTAGTLDWADGDAASKTITIPILNASFTGSKTLALGLSSPTGGAVIGNPGSTTITITGSGGGGSGAPSAPSGLRMTGQGANSISLSWSAAAPGTNPIAKYKIYRNGTAYDSTTSTSYTDNGATNATNGNYTAAATIYSYTVSAVDSEGGEGPQTAETTFDVYANGVYSWAGDYSYSASANYQDTSGNPESGPYDIQVTVNSAYGGFQPYAGNVVPQWDLEAGSFGYISVDLKPTISGQKWTLSAISRLPPGDVYPWAAVNVTDYGPAPQPGVWATYKVPLSALSIGITHFQGSISGDTLTVTSVNGGPGVDAGGFISGSGVRPGTYIVGHHANGGPGTYTISPSQDVAGTSMTEQRTALYKFDISDQSGASWNHFYVDNMKFLAQ
jgi:hypothetical protein